ncbi:MAG TPA: EAL domain-containing protein [Candidatus Limnocylindrales bacterium]|nr:EAL domain-containing protein [Candidatus Limnocylindrales bacterium]
MTPDASLDAHLDGLVTAISSAQDLPGIYRALAAFAAATTPTTGIFVALYEAERAERVCVFSSAHGVEEDIASLPPLPLNASPNSRAIITGRPVMVDDYQSSVAGLPKHLTGMAIDPREPQSALALPLVVLGRVIGAFEVQSEESAAFGPQHIPALSIAASVAAFATEVVRLEDRHRAAVTIDLEARSRRIEAILAARSFSPVYQPIVDLHSGHAVGYEALTRFDDGTPPDLVFSDAARLGLGIELETAAIEVALVGSAPLPATAWLDLNVSPATVLAGEPLRGILQRWDWHTVLELTEHTAIADYAGFRAVLATLPEVRLAVDDAGAGFASLRHILELGPHLVKLDRTLVAGIDTDPARQALVAGMLHFARVTGCELVGEGIERRAEAISLRGLGVGLGQGYYLARPAPAAELSRTTLAAPHLRIGATA